MTQCLKASTSGDYFYFQDFKEQKWQQPKIETPSDSAQYKKTKLKPR
jgi:hypothetical protein